MDRSAIKINFATVYATLDELRGVLDQEVVAETENRYGQISHLLGQVDGATNAETQAAMDMNKEKTMAVAATMRKLLAFMENAARAVEQEDAHLAGQLEKA